MTHAGATSFNPNNIISQSQMEQLKNAMTELKYSNKNVCIYIIPDILFCFLLKILLSLLEIIHLVDKRISKEYAKMLFE